MYEKKWLGNIILLGTAFVWGMAFAFQKTGMDHVGPFTFAACRHFLSFAALLLFILIRDAAGKRKGRHPSQVFTKEEYARYKKDTLKAGVLCGVFLSAASILQQIGLVTGSAGKAGFVTALYVVLVPIACMIFFGKRPGPMQWAAAAISVLGLYLLCVHGNFAFSPEDLFFIGGALGFTMEVITCEKYVAHADPVGISMLQFLVGALVSALFAMTVEPMLFTFDTSVLAGIKEASAAIIYCGIFSGALGYTGQIIGQKYAEPVAASLLMSLESVFSVVGGWLLLHEVMSARELLGCAVMFAAVIASQQPDIKAKKRNK